MYVCTYLHIIKYIESNYGIEITFNLFTVLIISIQHYILKNAIINCRMFTI